MKGIRTGLRSLPGGKYRQADYLGTDHKALSYRPPPEQPTVVGGTQALESDLVSTPLGFQMDSSRKFKLLYFLWKGGK